MNRELIERMYIQHEKNMILMDNIKQRTLEDKIKQRMLDDENKKQHTDEEVQLLSETFSLEELTQLVRQRLADCHFDVRTRLRHDDDGVFDEAKLVLKMQYECDMMTKFIEMIKEHSTWNKY